MTPHGTVEGGVAEGKDPTVFGHQPVTTTVGGGGHSDHRLIEGMATHGPIETSLTKGEDSAIRSRHPQPLGGGRGNDHLLDQGLEVCAIAAVHVGYRRSHGPTGSSTDAGHVT